MRVDYFFAGIRRFFAAPALLTVVLSVDNSLYAATAPASATAQINDFTSDDWLHGIWHNSAGFSIPANAANQAAFVKDAQVTFADGQQRSVTMVFVVGPSMSVYVDGVPLDGNSVGYPNAVSTGMADNGSGGEANMQQTATISLNSYTNADWLNGFLRNAAGFSIPLSAANQALFQVGVTVTLADGQVRTVTTVQTVGNNLSILLSGAALDGNVVGYPNTVAVTTSSPADIDPTLAGLPLVTFGAILNDFTNSDWLHGILRNAPGFSIAASSANVTAFREGASVMLADGQIRQIALVQNFTSSMSVILSGTALDGDKVGYPNLVFLKNPAVTGEESPTPSSVAEPIALISVNLSGAAFHPEAIPGVYGENYLYPDESYFQKYAAAGVQSIRLPFLWERLQPTLNAALNETELARLTQSLDLAKKYGLSVILDLHNYYRYNSAQIGSATVPISAFADFWTRVAQVLSNHPALYAYGLMNEPHDTNGYWPQAALAAAQAIRILDSKHWIFIAGERWSSAYHWPTYNNQLITDAWMRDPANKLVYEAHLYLDGDYSGNYSDSSETYSPMLGVERASPFVQWLKENGLRGYLGEHGVPDYSLSGMVAMDNLLNYLGRNCIPLAYWAAGPWWGNYPLALDVDSTIKRPQLPILRRYAAQTGCASVGPLTP